VCGVQHVCGLVQVFRERLKGLKDAVRRGM
jgi:hypothetical protein